MQQLLFLLSIRGLGLLNFDDDNSSGERHMITRFVPNLGEARGIVQLYDHVDATGSEPASVHPKVFSEIHKRAHTERQVRIETLDDVAARAGITSIDLLKIDTEGHELAVLNGAKGLLESGLIGRIQLGLTELNVISWVFFRDFRKLLPGCDFYRLLAG